MYHSDDPEIDENSFFLSILCFSFFEVVGCYATGLLWWVGGGVGGQQCLIRNRNANTTNDKDKFNCLPAC